MATVCDPAGATAPAPEPTSTLATAGSADAVAGAILHYLRGRLGTRTLGYGRPPVEFTHGWETYTYAFRLCRTFDLPAPFARPLVARIYASEQGATRAEHEFRVQQFLYAVGYPVAEPLLLETRPDWFGAPFLLMAEVPGRMLLEELLARPWYVALAPRDIARTQLRLHRLPPTGFPNPRTSFLERRSREMAELIATYRLAGLADGLDWLERHRPTTPERRSILHLDFHPTNLMRVPHGSLVVLDWPEADVGDPHADVATSTMMMECMPTGAASHQDRLAVALGRTYLRRAYVRAYRRRALLDRGLLTYYQAFAALRRLCAYGRWLSAGPTATGSKPSSVEHLRPEHLERLVDYFRSRTGVRVAL